MIAAPALSRNQGDVYWKDFCTKQNTGGSTAFNFMPGKKQMTYDIFASFKAGRKLGEGSFGVVRESKITEPDGTKSPVAIKVMDPKNYMEVGLIRDEINIMAKLGISPHFPRLYGCAYKDSDQIAVAQELLSHSLDSKTFRTVLATQTNAESIALYREIFIGMKELWDKGYAHCDFKPENVMTDENNKLIKIIDFGLAEDRNSYNSPRGSPMFMSPGKYTDHYLVKRAQIAEKDDMYSIAMSIVIMEAPDSYDDVKRVLTYDEYRRAYTYGKIDNQCFMKYNSPDCRKKIIANAKRILEKNKYGTFDDNVNRNTINFTTLICWMLEYDNFRYSYADVIAILDRMILEDQKQAQKKLDAEEAIKKEAERLAIENHQKKLKKIAEEEQLLKLKLQKERDELRKEKKVAEVYKETLRANHDPEVEMKATQQGLQLDKMLKEVRENEERMNKLKKDMYREKKEADRAKIPAKYETNVYRENKELLNPRKDGKVIDLTDQVVGEQIAGDVFKFVLEKNGHEAGVVPKMTPKEKKREELDQGREKGMGHIVKMFGEEMDPFAPEEKKPDLVLPPLYRRQSSKQPEGGRDKRPSSLDKGLPAIDTKQVNGFGQVNVPDTRFKKPEVFQYKDYTGNNPGKVGYVNFRYPMTIDERMKDVADQVDRNRNVVPATKQPFRVISRYGIDYTYQGDKKIYKDGRVVQLNYVKI